MGCLTSKKPFDSGADPDPDPDPGIFDGIFTPDWSFARLGVPAGKIRYLLLE